MFDPASFSYECPSCSGWHPAPFTGTCPSCGFNASHLSGTHLTDFQQRKYEKHTVLLTGSNIPLGPGQSYNASFDHSGDALLGDLVRFAVTYGDKGYVDSVHGGHKVQVRAAFVPEIIGTGTSYCSSGGIACSGVCLIAPQSFQWGHPIPMLDEWVAERFRGVEGTCASCGTNTPFGTAFCESCLGDIGYDWSVTL